jgi:DNA-binding MarR family transcriptional regulator
MPTGIDTRAGSPGRLHDNAPGMLLYLTKQLERSVRARLEEVVSAEGLTSLQYTALTVLERSPGLTATKLARNSFVRAQTMAQMINSLERRELIERSRDTANKRQYLISLTKKGADTLNRLREPVNRVEDAMLTGLRPDEVEALRRTLRHCRRALAGGHPASA